MRFVAFIALILSSVAFAGEYAPRKLSMSFFGDGLNRIHYRCEVAKDLVMVHLENLGATNIKLNCAGGLEDWGPSRMLTPMHISAKFDVPVATSNDAVETVVIKSQSFNEDCFLNTQFLNQALPLFPAAKVVKKQASCMNNYSRWSYTVELSK